MCSATNMHSEGKSAPKKMCSEFSLQKIREGNESCASRIEHRALCGTSCVLRSNLVFGQ